MINKQTAAAVQPLNILKPDTIYTTAELLQYISKDTLTTATRHNLLTRIKRGFYIINFINFPLEGGN